MKKVLLQGGVFVLLLLFTLNYYFNPFESDHGKEVNQNAIQISATASDPLYQKISEYAKKHDIEPINATIDRVWKKIPGYNGLIVDKAASYKQMKIENQFDPTQIVLKEVKPKIQLKDLPPSPIYKGNPEKPMVALMINVAWGNEYLPTILKVLKKNQVKATFFLDGSWVKKNPDLANLIKEEGHEIGNHAYSHPDMRTLSKGQIEEQIKKTNDVIKATLNLKPKWFAPPSGSFNDEVVQTADHLGMGTVLWTVDTVDWKNPQTSIMLNRVSSQVGAGSMILMHPTKPTAEGLNTMIHDIQSRGYQLGTVSQLLSEKRVPGNH